MYKQATRELMLLDLQSRPDAICDKRVISAFERVHREEFVPDDWREDAYKDKPIPIGFGQTISQPFTVAKMTEILEVRKGDKVLEIGTGSGYQAAILSELVGKEGGVFTTEIIDELRNAAKKRLKKLGYENVRTGGKRGMVGWRRYSPYERIVVTAGIDESSQDLKELLSQLKDAGILVAPIGEMGDYTMTRIRKSKNKIKKEELGLFRFVPYIETV